MSNFVPGCPARLLWFGLGPIVASSGVGAIPCSLIVSLGDYGGSFIPKAAPVFPTAISAVATTVS